MDIIVEEGEKVKVEEGVSYQGNRIKKGGVYYARI